jgi:hypothetical protein
MIYNLILNKTDLHSSSVGTKCVFAVDWSFLPEGKKYIMKWKLQTVGSAGWSSLIRLRQYNLHFTNQLNNVATDGKYNGVTSVVGGAYYDIGRWATDITCLNVRPDYNTPIMLMDRPSDNFLLFTTFDTVDIEFNALTIINFILILSFDDDVDSEE